MRDRCPSYSRQRTTRYWHRRMPWRPSSSPGAWPPPSRLPGPDPAAVRPHVVHVPGNDRPRWRPGTTAHRPGLVGRGSSGGRTATLRRRSRARRMHHHLKALTALDEVQHRSDLRIRHPGPGDLVEFESTGDPGRVALLCCWRSDSYWRVATTIRRRSSWTISAMLMSAPDVDRWMFPS